MAMWRCKDGRCGHSRTHGEPRRHGYCCKGCKDGMPHTPNCSGYGQPYFHRRDRSRGAASSHVTSDFQPPACDRRDCPFVRRYGSPRRHGFCCNACKDGEAGHTYNCTGYGYMGTYHAPATLVATAAITQEVVEEPDVEEPEPEAIPAFPGMYRTYSFRDRGPAVCDTFRIPVAWACGDSDDDFMQHLQWFFDRYGLIPEFGVLRSWQEFQPRIHRGDMMHRPLTIHVLSELKPE